MPFAQCPKCAVDVRFKTQNAGKRVRCASCSAVFALPDAPEQGSHSEQVREAEQLATRPESAPVAKPSEEPRPLSFETARFVFEWSWYRIVFLLGVFLLLILNWMGDVSVKSDGGRVVNNGLVADRHDAIVILSALLVAGAIPSSARVERRRRFELLPYLRAIVDRYVVIVAVAIFIVVLALGFLSRAP